MKVAEKTSPNQKMSFEMESSAAGQRGAPYRCLRGAVRPRRMAHVLIFTRDVLRAMEFYSRTLGLRLSDRTRGGIAFLHGIHGSDHHLIAFAKSKAPGFHHCSWDVPPVNDVGLGAMQMADKGYSAGWGLGRHVLGSNYFHYVRDPGEANANTPTTSTTFPSIATGTPPTARPKIRFISGGRNLERTSRPTTKQ